MSLSSKEEDILDNLSSLNLSNNHDDCLIHQLPELVSNCIYVYFEYRIGITDTV